MAQKLTEQEQAAVVALAKLLGKGLPARQRGNAGGIASGLVRMRKNPLAEEDVRSVIEKYDGDEETLPALVELGILSPAAETGGFALAVPVDDGTLVAAPRQAPAQQPQRHRGASRSLSHLDCVRKQTPELADVRRQIIGLDPRMWINGWLLSTPDAFLLYERELRAIDALLVGRPTLGDGTMSCRELSYRIFGDEKFLGLESDGRKLLHLMGISDLVTFRPQLKLELLHHVPKHHRHLRLVVSENLDPWVNVRNALFREGRKHILGERVHGVVFGNGYLVDDPHKLPDLLASFDADDVTVLYWGDLDRAGLLILERLERMAEEREAGEKGGFVVQPFVAAYRLMLRRAMERFPEPLDNEPTDQANVPMTTLGPLEGRLKPREESYLRAVIEGARLIPQEILTAADL